jgi:hypothetical protein
LGAITFHCVGIIVINYLVYVKHLMAILIQFINDHKLHIIVMIWVKIPLVESLKGLDIALNYTYIYIYTYFLKKSQGKHNDLNCQYFFWDRVHYLQVSMLKI